MRNPNNHVTCSKGCEGGNSNKSHIKHMESLKSVSYKDNPELKIKCKIWGKDFNGLHDGADVKDITETTYSLKSNTFVLSLKDAKSTQLDVEEF